MAPSYGWGSTASRLEPLRGGNLLFTTKFPEIPGTHFIDLERMKGWVDLGATQWIWTRDPWIGNVLYWLLYWNLLYFLPDYFDKTWKYEPQQWAITQWPLWSRLFCKLFLWITQANKILWPKCYWAMGTCFWAIFFKLISNLETIFLYQV